jgi:hypothetical protein
VIFSLVSVDVAILYREFVNMMRRNLAQSLHDAGRFDFLLCFKI